MTQGQKVFHDRKPIASWADPTSKHRSDFAQLRLSATNGDQWIADRKR